MSEVNVETPETFKLSNSVCPSTSRSLLALIVPDTVNEVSVPKDVSDEFVTPEPIVVAERTSVPSILYVLLEARFKFSLDLSEVLE